MALANRIAEQIAYNRAREAGHLAWIEQTDRQVNEEIQRLMQSTADTLMTEANAWLTKYATNNGISLAEASKLVSEADMEALARKAKIYVATRDFSPQANKEMKLYNLTMKLSRHELLLRRMNLETLMTFDEVEKIMERHLQNVGEHELHRQAMILDTSVPDRATTSDMAKTIVHSSFHSATFSERIWSNREVLTVALADGIKKSIMMGKHPTVWMREMSGMLTEAFAGSSYALKRLAVTESARVQIEVQREAYKSSDYEQFVVLCEPTACDICTPHDEKIYDVLSMQPGINAPPFHPNCKCSTAAHMERPDIISRDTSMLRTNQEGNRLAFNLQKFAKKLTDEEKLKSLFDKQVFSKNEFRLAKKHFDGLFKNGVSTPIGTVFDNSKRFKHIISNHPDMIELKQIDAIIKVLVSPSSVIQTTDANGILATAFVGKSRKTIVVITREGDIVTAYRPSLTYLERMKQKGTLIYEP